MLVTTGEEIVGLKKRHERDEWFDKECEEATDFKNKTYKFMIQRKCTRAVKEEYRKARRREKKIHRGKKREYMMRQMITVYYGNNTQHDQKCSGLQVSIIM